MLMTPLNMQAIGSDYVQPVNLHTPNTGTFGAEDYKMAVLRELAQPFLGLIATHSLPVKRWLFIGHDGNMLAGIERYLKCRTITWLQFCWLT